MNSRIVLAFLFLAACRSSAAPDAPTPQADTKKPGRPATTATAITTTAIASAPDLELTIELATKPSLEIRYRTAANAAADGSTTFQIDDRWGGVEDAATLVLDPRFTGANGRALESEHSKPNEWVVRSKPD